MEDLVQTDLWVPSGHQVSVPVKPTQAMLEALFGGFDNCGDTRRRELAEAKYGRMLESSQCGAATPAQPQDNGSVIMDPSAWDLIEAAKSLHDEYLDYSLINNLTGHNNHNVRWVRRIP